MAGKTGLTGNSEVERARRITKAAERLFFVHGFEACTVDDIAAAALVSKRDLYRHHRSKADLFEAVARNIFGHARAALVRIPAQSDDRRTMLARYALCLLDAFVGRTSLGLSRTIIAAGRHFPDLAAYLDGQRTDAADSMAAYFGRLIEEGYLVLREPVPAMVRFGGMAVEGCRYLLGVKAPPPAERTRIATAITELFLHGYRGLTDPLLVLRPATATPPALPREASMRLSAEKVGQLMTVARRRFLAQGYRRTRLDQIASDAGVSPATLYRHFTNKEGLFAHLIHAEIHGIAGRPQYRPRPGGDLEVALARLARDILDRHAHADNIALQRLLIEEATTFPKLGPALYQALLAGTTRDLQAVLHCHGAPAASGFAARAFYTLATLGTRLVVLPDAPAAAERDARCHETARLFLRGCAR